MRAEASLTRAQRVHLVLGLCLVVTGACAPTLSKPRGEAHLAALAQAETHQHHGRHAEAVKAYELAAQRAERRVDRDEALYRASRVLARMEQYPRAIAICDRLAQDTPARRTLRARLDASRYRLEVGDEERAERDLTALVLQHPESGPARSALRLLLQRNVHKAPSHEEALAWVRDISARAGQSSMSESLMGSEAELLVALGRRSEAMAVLEQQVVRFPYPTGRRWDNALWRLADLALDAEDPKRAIAYLERMIEVHESSAMVGSYTRPQFSKAALRIARIYRDALHDVSAAIEAYGEVRDEFPRSLVVDDALEEEAQLRMARGERAQACELLRELVEQHQVGSARRRAQERVAAKCSRAVSSTP